jgi:hypothetical protein
MGCEPNSRVAKQSFPASEDNFRFGNGEPGERIIGYQGGAGKGLGYAPNGRLPDRPMPSCPTARETFAFGNGEPGARVIGYRGGAGKGLGDEPNGRPKPTYPTDRDSFAFGNGEPGSRVINYLGGAQTPLLAPLAWPDESKGVVTPTLSQAQPEPAAEVAEVAEAAETEVAAEAVA